MKKVRIVALFAMTLGALSFAKVTGNRAEIFGTEWNSLSLRSWSNLKSALVNPELVNLSAQSCLRDSQERLDLPAYQVANTLVSEMNDAFSKSRDPYGISLFALSKILKEITEIPLASTYPSADEYVGQCNAMIGKALSDSRSDLQRLYDGRMHPRTPADLARRGITLNPLTWKGLEEQICTLEGYYSTTREPSLWKFFSITRAMSNVLPAEKDNDAFTKEVMAAPKVVKLIGTLNRYSSVAGKYNGASIGMTADEIRRAPVRMTGPAVGTRTTALMAFFTTGWREQLQKLTMDRPYPQKPFQLLTADEVLRSVESTFADSSPAAQHSQTELGMDLVWSLISPFYKKPATTDLIYGAVTEKYRQASALAWLALNAETNIRQNEKIPGLGGSAAPRPPTPWVLGDPAAYAQIGQELALAVDAYRAIDQTGQVSYCVKGLQDFATAAQKIGLNQVANVDPTLTRFLMGTKFEPVIADIGTEVKDIQDGEFRLQLAIGYGHEVPVTVDGKDYTLWTPSAMVLHRSKITTTAQWQRSLVKEFDKP